MKFRTLPATFIAVVLGGSVCISAQNTHDTCIATGFSGHGPVVIGTISNTNLTPAKGLPTVTLSIAEYLRGPKFKGDTVDIPVDWTAGPMVGYPGRAPVWYSVVPRTGKDVLILLWQPSGEVIPLCVMDMDPPDYQAVNLIKRLVQLDETPPDQKVGAMEAALADSEIAVRNEAINYLTRPTNHNSQIRLAILEHFAPIAADSHNPLRFEAIESIKKAYDSFSRTSDTNYQILSFIVSLMVDPDPRMRSIAVQSLHSQFFGGGSNKPDLSRIHITDRAKTIQRLQQDIAEEQEYAEQAQRLLTLLSTGM